MSKSHTEIWVLTIENNRVSIKAKRVNPSKVFSQDEKIERECTAIEQQIFISELKKAQAKVSDKLLLMLNRSE